MKVALHTVDLFPGRERLMPFRTVLEVAKVMNNEGWEAHVVNSSVSDNNASNFEWNGVKIVQCPRVFSEMSTWINQNQYDAFYFAATIREGLKDLRGLSLMKCKKIAYVPSGITPKKNALFLLRQNGIYAKAWCLEAFTPKWLLANKLKKVGFTDIIGLTDYTSKMVGTALRVHTIYPGKDHFEKIASDKSILIQHQLIGKKYYLFTGGPAPSRGGAVLLRAFDDMVQDCPEALLVFLMRHDVGGEYDGLLKTLESLKHRKNVIVLKEKLNVNQLKAYFEGAYAVVLPFICIPAEIPLTYYEVMSCGTPVISFTNAGTTTYLDSGLVLAKDINKSGLKKTLFNFWMMDDMRETKGLIAKQIMERHIDWHQAGLKWMNVIRNS